MVRGGNASQMVFNKPIISTPQAPISTKDVLIRLQQLQEELATVDLEHPDLTTFNKIKDDLVNPRLLKSNNVGVQAFVCCSLADLFRIYAPDAPFTGNQLSMIFKAFFNQFKKLSDVHNPYFQQQCYLLKRLAEVRSTILITDLEDAQALTENIFNVFYDLSNKEFPQKLEPLICDILSDIMSEAEEVPHNVLKLILDKLTFAAESLTSEKISNPGFNFSVSICEANVDRLSRQVAQYFSEMLYESSVTADNGTVEERLKSTHGLDTIKRIHKLSVQIWKYVPGLLSAVMGLIDDELNADHEIIRVLATETIGQMISSSDSFSSFIVNYKETWFNWLKKPQDVSSSVRCKWIERVCGIISNLNGLTSEASSALCLGVNVCLRDPDEKVRLVTCVSIEKISFDRFTRVCNKDTMNILSQLIRERNSDIRKQAITILCNQCNQYFEAVNSHKVIDFGDKNQQESADLQEHVFKEIPSQLLSLIYINDKEITSTLDICFFEKILPFEDNLIKRVDRLCQLFGSLDEKSKSAFFAIIRRQQQNSGVVSQFISLCEEYGKLGSLDDKENMIIRPNEEKQTLLSKIEKAYKWFCVTTPDSYNSELCFERFFKLKNFRFLQLIRLAISPDSDFATVKSAMRELLTKLSNPKTIRLDSDRTNISTTDMVSTFKLLMYKSSMIIYNKSNIMELINYSKNPNHQWNGVSNELLNHIAATVPGVLKNHIDNLVEIIKDSNIKSGLRVSCLRTLYRITKKYPDMLPKNVDETLQQLCFKGSPVEAKFAMKLIQYSSKKGLFCSEIIEKGLPLDLKAPNVTTTMSVVAEILLMEPGMLDVSISDLTTILIKNVLLINEITVQDQTSIQDHPNWLSDSTLDLDNQNSQLIQKLASLKIFTNRLFSLKSRDLPITEAEEISKPVIKLLHTIITCGGEIVGDKETPTPTQYQARLRLEAGLNLLKLAKCSEYESYFTNDVLLSLAYLLQDENINVRSAFLKALQKKLSKGNIPDKFIVLMSFMNNEPDTQLQYTVETWIRSAHKRSQAKKEMRVEKTLVRLIHLISHSDKFDHETPMESFKYGASILLFFLNHIIDADNISLLYYLASRVKQFRDATIDQHKYDIRPHNHEVTDLYSVAELGQLVIKEYGEVKNWSTLSWPGKVALPKELFTPMLSTSEAQAIISKVYIEEDVQVSLRLFIRQSLGQKTQKKRSASAVQGSALKKSRVSQSAPRKAIEKKVKKKVVVEPTRKSSRSIGTVNYDDEESEGSGEPESDEETSD